MEYLLPCTPCGFHLQSMPYVLSAHSHPQQSLGCIICTKVKTPAGGNFSWRHAPLTEHSLPLSWIWCSTLPSRQYCWQMRLQHTDLRHSSALLHGSLPPMKQLQRIDTYSYSATERQDAWEWHMLFCMSEYAETSPVPHLDVSDHLHHRQWCIYHVGDAKCACALNSFEGISQRCKNVSSKGTLIGAKQFTDRYFKCLRTSKRSHRELHATYPAVVSFNVALTIYMFPVLNRD